jgi:leader peptidase (prepilin peptidase)/N-methyltransferase
VTAIIAAICGVLGLAIGSFLNVVIHRVPKRESVIRPRSRCPSCGTQLAERDNIPVVSWLLLRGRCRTCSAPISVRYPLIELLTAVVFAAAGARFAAHPEVIPAYLLFFACLISVSAIDLDLFIIPNRIIYPTLFASVPLLVLAAAVGHRWTSLEHAAIGGLAAWAALLVIHFISPRGMGFGDVRLVSIIGVYTGWLGYLHVFVGVFLGFLVAAVVGIALMVTRRKGRKDAVPFGPFLAVGATLAVFAGTPIIHAWLGTGA